MFGDSVRDSIPATLEERLESAEKMKKQLLGFEYGRTYAANADAFGMHTLSELVKMKVLEMDRGELRLTAIGKHESSRLNHVITLLNQQIIERDVAAMINENDTVS